MTVAIAGVAADAASASTFYVNSAGSDTNPCTSAGAPCKTIGAAVTKSEASPDAATIEVAAGIYTGAVLLAQAGDSNITINGAGSGTSGTVILESASEPAVIAASPSEGPVTLRHLRLVVGSTDSDPAAVFNEVPYALQDVAIEMQDSASTAPALVDEERASATLDHVSIGGSWKGGLMISASSTSIVHSSLISNESGLLLTNNHKGEGDTDLIQDSTVQSSSNVSNINVLASGVNLTVDSSLLLGGNPYDIDWVQAAPGKPKLLTVAGSTLDAGLLGVDDGALVNDIFATTDGPPTAPATVQIEGSILLEQQSAHLAEMTDQLAVNCSYSDVPSQKQAAKGTEGSINCASGENGNTTSTPASLFVAPGTNYNLNPTSSAVDSVPAGAIALPFGVAPSPTDLAANPRTVDGNGDCVALQDKGALELQGHSAPCPSPTPPAKPMAASITGLSISPSAFLAAPSGATTSRTKKAKSYGTTISYKDSQTATTTFTVLKQSSGRTQGKACKKPSKANKHGKRCTIYTAIGSFIHNDAAGANKLHFSGRIKGKKLAKGSYKLQAVPHDAAGNGAAVSKQFEIK